MEENKKRINVFRVLFRVGLLSFSIANSFSTTCGNKFSKLKALYTVGLDEAEKETPSFYILEYILEEISAELKKLS